MEFDLVIRNGTVVDGSGAPGFRGDVAVVDGKIAEVGEIDGAGREEIDADGLVVTPGFVDGHTHMDAQVFWDDLGTPGCWHGVTSVVMGNCGFTLAPASAEQSPLVVRNLERAEDIAADAMREGITWSWTTFREFFDTIEALPKGLNYAGSIGHSALRTFAMGERAFTDTASADDLAVMDAELRDALNAGAVGFTTSRSGAHETSDDRPVASRLAEWDEIQALVGTLGQQGDGVFQISQEDSAFHGDPDDRADYFARLRALALESGAPIAFGVFASLNFEQTMDLINGTWDQGGEMYGLTHCRGVGTLSSFRTATAFDRLPEWGEIRRRPFDEQRRLFEDPEVRARLVHEAHHADYGRALGVEPPKPVWDRMHIVESPYLPNPTVAQEAARLGKDPVEVVIDLALASDFHVFFQQGGAAQPPEGLAQLLRSPYCSMTFSDSGAHVSQIVDCSITTHLLAYWVRERQLISVEEAVHNITAKPAALWRLRDRGQLKPGYAADVTIFDLDRLVPDMPIVVDDLPGGSRRLVQTAQGYVATIVNGEVLTRDGKATDTRPGQLLRSATAG